MFTDTYVNSSVKYREILGKRAHNKRTPYVIQQQDDVRKFQSLLFYFQLILITRTIYFF